jgi:aminobenzoyl-glutamate utilization protein B
MADPDKDFVVSWVAQHGAEFKKYSDAVWSYAELGCEENLSSRLLADLLRERGFRVEMGVAGMPTAFVASFGSGNPIVGVNCEYDALPGLSQEERSEKKPVVEGAPGHGCGHSILGVGSCLAAIALKEWLVSIRRTGVIKVLGTPAEEICIGKPFMARSGLFEGMDAIIDWHPWNHNGAGFDTSNAYFNIKYHFRGRTAHGNAPWDGRSALDGAVLAGHAIELLREHIPPGNPEAANTINYTFSDVGPEYPNVVPDRSTLWLVGRITTAAEMEDIIARVDKCAEGAAQATGTRVEREFITAIHETIPNKTLSAVLHRNLTEIGPPRFDLAEQKLARQMQRELGVTETGLNEGIDEFTSGCHPVSDNSEFSWFAPFAMAWIAAGPPDIGWHNWQIAALVKGSVGHKAMVTAAKVLAASAVELLTRTEIIATAKAELAERMPDRSYRSLIPSDIAPPLEINRKTMEKYRELMAECYESL